MPENKIFKVVCQGDILYVHTDTEDHAYEWVCNVIGAIPRHLLAISEVDELPEGEVFL